MNTVSIVMLVIFIFICAIGIIDIELKYKNEKKKFKNNDVYGVVTNIERYPNVGYHVDIKVGHKEIQAFEYDEDVNISINIGRPRSQWWIKTIKVGDYVQVIEEENGYRTDARLKKYSIKKIIVSIIEIIISLTILSYLFL